MTQLAIVERCASVSNAVYSREIGSRPVTLRDRLDSSRHATTAEYASGEEDVQLGSQPSPRNAPWPRRKSQRAILGAIGGRYRATQGDAPRQFAQLDALQSDVKRCIPTLRGCLLSSGSQRLERRLTRAPANRASTGPPRYPHVLQFLIYGCLHADSRAGVSSTTAAPPVALPNSKQVGVQVPRDPQGHRARCARMVHALPPRRRGSTTP